MRSPSLPPDERVCGRSPADRPPDGPGATPAGAAGGRTAVEADHVDDAFREGWSAMVRAVRTS
ncbi:hypothetical protein ACIQVK_52220 [Streptomyces sp. NPDC090493]|uniref:hypothetical protein n=1 Tax=Streptomyces sp. NPDC090493 TaxID=3365964 RepID=UPI00381C84D0